jgi:peroxiredoxin
MKKNRIRLAATLAILAAMAVIGLRGFFGNTAPDVEFTTLKGERIRLRELRGHPVLVTFWASDCRACIEEMPDLADLHRQFAERGFKLISVAMAYDLPNRVLAMAEERHLPYPVALDPLGRIAAAFERVSLVPNSFLIAPDGRVALHALGRVSADELRERVRQMLPEA